MEERRQSFPVKGRGVGLLQALQRLKASRPGGTSATTLEEPEPPKPRGRAALLQKMAEMRKSIASSSCYDKPVQPTSNIVESLESMSIAGSKTYTGTSGSVINVTANYMRLEVDPDRGVFEYDVWFDPEVDSKGLRIRFINSQITEIGGTKSFDGGTCLYLPIKLPLETTHFSCPHPNEDYDVTMTVVYKKKKMLGECIHLYNVLFKRVMHVLLYSRIGRNYYDPQHSYMIPQHKLEVLPGYAVSVDQTEGGILLCLDTQHRVLRTQNVYDLLIELRLMCKERFREAAYKSLVGAVLLTRYNNKTYIVDDILWDANPECTFETRDGCEIRYSDYYKNQHNLQIADTKQPLLVNKVSRKVVGSAEKQDRFICLIPELCYMTGLTDEMRSDFKVMKDVALCTRVTPNQRMNALRTYIENVNKCPEAQKVLAEWGLKLAKSTVDLSARVMDPETIIFGRDVTVVPDRADWSGAMSKNKVTTPVDLLSWIVMFTPRDRRYAEEFGQNMQRLGNVMGMRISQPIPHMLKDDRTDTYVQACKNLISNKVQIIVFICPTLRDDRYSAIKKICCYQMPIPSQVIFSKTLSNPTKVRSITQKIALQINCKLGGSLWSVRLPFKDWMICGIDVYHSPNMKQPVCAFVCNLNEDLSKWYSTVVFQDREVGDFLKTCLVKGLEKYRHANGVFPSKIIIFRDGLGEGQLKHCLHYEVAQFEECLKQYNVKDSKICMVVVQKRINTRIFLKKGSELENPHPGTVLDNTVTMRNWYDFFLVSQNVRQGTVTPTHYIVIHDACNLKPDHVQRLAYKLCHLYYNWPGTIRVPAPCQYAHKLAFLVGQHIGKVPAKILEDRLFYL